MLRKLAGHTAIYGLSSILGRVVNFLLTPLYTYVLASEAVYGSMSVIYSYVAFLAVILTFGMETSYFKFSNKSDEREDQIYGTTFSNVLGLNLGFILFGLLFHSGITSFLELDSTPYLAYLIVIVVSFDAIAAMPLARLRNYGKSKTFALIQLASILTNISLNILFLVGFKYAQESWGLNGLYNEDYQLYYIFIANVCSSLLKLSLALAVTKQYPTSFQRKHFKRIFNYAWPLAIAGLAGITNETLDRILLLKLLPGSPEEAKAQIGIYSANYKIAMLISLFVQAYRYAAEPLFFAQQETKEGPKKYALAMKWFVIVSCFAFLCISLFLPLIQSIVIPNPVYWEGAKIVPIILLANIFLGIYFNLSTWYKVTDQTKYGARYSIIGAVITICFNLILIPIIGYMGSAITTLLAYVTITVFSYFGSREHYPIPYNLRKIFFYLGLTLALYFLSLGIDFDNLFLNNFARLLLIIPYLVIIFKVENLRFLKNGTQSNQ